MDKSKITAFELELQEKFKVLDQEFKQKALNPANKIAQREQSLLEKLHNELDLDKLPGELNDHINPVIIEMDYTDPKEHLNQIVSQIELSLKVEESINIVINTQILDSAHWYDLLEKGGLILIICLIFYGIVWFGLHKSHTYVGRKFQRLGKWFWDFFDD